jgi:hypothetical protein
MLQDTPKKGNEPLTRAILLKISNAVRMTSMKTAYVVLNTILFLRILEEESTFLTS